MWIPDLSPLIDVHFETNDDEEASIIYEVIQSLENHSPWPYQLYRSGDAATVLKPYAMKALEDVVEHYDVEMEMRRSRVRKQLFPKIGPPACSFGDPKPQNVEVMMARVQEAVEVEEVQVVYGDVQKLVESPVKKKAKRETVCALRKAEPTPEKKKKGKDFHMSPPASDELDPEYHASPLLKMGNPSPR